MVFFRVKLGTLFFLERMKMGFRERRWRSFLQRRLGKEKRVSLSLFILAKSTNKTSFSFPSIFNYIQNNNVFILFNYEKNLIFFFFSIFSTIFKTILSNNYYKILTLLFWSNLFFFELLIWSNLNPSLLRFLVHYYKYYYTIRIFLTLAIISLFLLFCYVIFFEICFCHLF